MMGPAASHRFWSKVDKRGPNDCWLWTAGKQTKGYGQFWLGAKVRAHRVSWEMVNGPIPAGLCVLHRCDVRACVNPAHLWLGTRSDNSADMSRKGRATRGARSHSAKLTREMVRQIRHVHPSKTTTRLGEIFGVAPGTIGRAVRREAWRHI